MRAQGAAWLVGTAWLACSCALGGHGGGVVSAPAADPWRQLPGAAALLARAEGTPAASPGGWRLRGAPRRAPDSLFSAAPLEALAPATAAGAIRLQVAGGEAEVQVTRSGGGDTPGQLAGQAVRYEGAGGLDSLVFAADGGLEDLVLVRDRGAHLVYEFALPTGWTLAPGVLTGEVDIRNRRGLAALRLSAPICWAEGGESRALSLRIEGSRVEVVASDGVEGAPLGSCRVVDPGFSLTGQLPSSLSNHVAVLLPSGKVLIAGGRLDDAANTVRSSLYLYDPWSGQLEDACADGPCVMSSARSSFTGTLLRDGRVLLAGGVVGCSNPTKNPPETALTHADLYDSLARTITTGPVPRCRQDHTSTLLPDGRVLLVGGVPEQSGLVDVVESFDPASNTFGAVGHLLTERDSHASVLLPTGKIVVVGGRHRNSFNSTNTPLDTAELFDPATGLSSALGPLSEVRVSPSATLLPGGDVLVAGGSPSGQSVGAVASMERLLAGDTDFQPTTSLQYPRAGHTAALLPSGYAVFVGGTTDGLKGKQSAETRESGDGLVSSLGDSLVRHDAGATSTVLPTGELLIVGGSSTQSELYGDPPVPSTYKGNEGTWSSSTSATPLLNGQILIAKSADYSDVAAEYPVGLFDPVSGNLTDGPVLPLAIGSSRSVALADGRVLFPGGEHLVPTGPGSYDTRRTAAAWVYDPQGNSLSPTGSLTQKRSQGTSTLLPDGRVLVVGGIVETVETINGKDYLSQDVVGTGEIYDPTTGTFAATVGLKKIELSHIRRLHTATRLLTGEVLVAGGTPLLISGDPTAELFQAQTGAFVPTGSMNQARASHAAVLLADGSVLMIGGSSDAQFLSSVERYDPRTGAFTTVGQLNRGRSQHTATLLPSGQVLVAGGVGKGGAFAMEIELFDPRSNKSTTVGQLSLARQQHSATLLPTGEVFFIGGGPAQSEHFIPQDIRSALRPTLTTLPSSIVGGTDGALTGADLDGFSEAGTGTSAGGTSRVPVPVWMPFGGGLVAGTVTQWTATTASYRPPATALNGPGWLFLITTGAPSLARGLVVERGVAGARCASSAACGSGFCVDGVCCPSACAGACEACSAAQKGQGPDGVCGPVPILSNPKGLCINQSGCGTKDYCDGQGQCALAPAGQACADAACIKGFSSPPSTCDQAGKCVPASMAKACYPGVCDAAGKDCSSACQVDQDCASGAFCKGGSCQAPGDAGAPCEVNAQCALNACVDGVCCDTPCDGVCVVCSLAKGASKDGACTPVKQGLDPEDECSEQPAATCGFSGVCNGSGGCARWGVTTVCNGATCQQGTGSEASSLVGQLCDGFGLCNASKSSCKLYRCEDAPVACKTTCAGDADCRGDAFCNPAAECQLRGELGAACSDDGSSCQSTHCVDGVCCDSSCQGLCRACTKAKTGGPDGTCAAVTQATDPDEECAASPAASCKLTGLCDGKSDCAFWPSGTISQPDTCQQGTGADESRIIGQVCDGLGSSQQVKTLCALYRCEDSTAVCKTTCAGDADCRGDAFCAGGTCQLRSALGAACSSAASCPGGSYCVDGVCCNAACGGGCEACDVAGSEGTCLPLPKGEKPHGQRPACVVEDATCGGLCDGTHNTCRYPDKGTSCGAPACEGGRQGAASVHACTSDGRCGGTTTTPCLPFACAAAACWDRCERDEQCAEGYACKTATGTCEALRQNICDADGVTSVAIDGKRQDCRPFRCGATGVCLAHCETSGDCADGARCDAQSVCVVAASAGPASESGCGCHEAPAAGHPAAALLSLLACAGLASRRRRARPC